MCTIRVQYTTDEYIEYYYTCFSLTPRRQDEVTERDV